MAISIIICNKMLLIVFFVIEVYVSKYICFVLENVRCTLCNIHRCVFLEKQTQLSFDSPQMQQQLALGLSVNVLKDQTWGSYRTVDLPNIIPESDILLELERYIMNERPNKYSWYYY